jgi:preprotein translocase subunit SecG
MCAGSAGSFMELVVLIIHLLVCICLIGLVLLQRSEGGALGMGGGGGGSLMSGRGAADALAKMTSVAGGFFLVTSLGLTVLSGASSASAGGSVLDNIVPRSSTIAPAAPVTPAPAPTETRPDPTESSAPQAADTRLASIMPGPAPAAAAPSTSGATRAGPLTTASNTQPTTARTTTPTTTRTVPPPTTTRSGATAVPASTGGTATVRPQPAATQRSTSTTTPPPPAPLVLPNTSGSVTGIALTDDPTHQTESIEIGGGVEAVRRERAGPDQ